MLHLQITRETDSVFRFFKTCLKSKHFSIALKIMPLFDSLYCSC